jgi:hypothetical protein
VIAVARGCFDSLAAHDHGATVGGGLCQGGLHRGERLLVDQRPDQGGFLEGVSYRQSAVHGCHPVDQLVGDGLMHDETTHGCASLPGGPCGGEDDAAHRQIEVR